MSKHLNLQSNEVKLDSLLVLSILLVLYQVSIHSPSILYWFSPSLLHRFDHLVLVFFLLLNATPADHCQKRIEMAHITQQNETYGLRRSPIRANFQKMPRRPVLFRSITDGIRARR